jgi:hypothetical protein
MEMATQEGTELQSWVENTNKDDCTQEIAYLQSDELRTLINFCRKVPLQVNCCTVDEDILLCLL